MAFVSYIGDIITFSLPNDFTLPIRIKSASKEEFRTALYLVDNILKSQDSLCINEFSNSKIKDIQVEYERQLDNLNKYHQGEINKLKNDITKKENLLVNATASNDTIHQQYIEENKRALLQHKEAQQHLISQIESSNERERNFMNTNINRLFQENKELNEKLQIRNTIQQNSSKKGTEGEKDFSQLVLEKKGWNLINTSKEGHSADFLLHIYDVQTRFEVKNYSGNIPTKEVEKVRRDMINHHETDICIFVSLGSGIVGFPSMSFEWTSSNQFILYVPEFYNSNMNVILDFIEIIIKTIKPYRSLLKTNSNNNHYHLIEKAMPHLHNVISNSVKKINQFNLDKKTLQNAVETLISNDESLMAAIKHELETVISVLSGVVNEEKVKKPKRARKGGS